MTGTVAEMGTGLKPVGGALPPLTLGEVPSLAALVAAGTVRVGLGTTLGPAAVVVPQGGAMGLPAGSWPAQILGDDGREYAVWLGDGVAIAHLALICGPVYLGERAFVGFRATVFNARIGADCTIGAHALVCDVEVPAGRAVPPGAIVTSQAQADRLPLVSAAETALAQYVTTALLGAEAAAASAPTLELLTVSEALAPTPTAQHTAPVTATTMATTMATTQISVEDVVRQYLSQGYRIGVEYADERRYRIGSWHSCATVAALSEREALAAVGACAAEHVGCYVRLFGVDASSKRRVGEAIVQRPQVPFAPGQAVTGSRAAAPMSGGTTGTGTSLGGGRITPVALTHIRQWLAAGYKLGTEHADERRFRTSSWHGCAPIAATSEAGAIAALEACLTEHQGEYVRLFGIDPKGKRRVAEVMLQRPGDGPGTAPPTPAAAGTPTGGMATAVRDTVRQLLAAGHKVAAEHADERRFRIGSWHSCGAIEAVTEANVLAALAACMAEHPGEYVRLVGVDPKAKRRVAEVMLQRPNGSSPVTSVGSAPAPATATTATASPAAQPGDGDVARQVREWLMTGHKIAMEYADARRFRIGSWQSCPPVTATTEAGVMAVLQEYRQQYGGQYLRVVGINATTKQRVGDRIVQRAV